MMDIETEKTRVQGFVDQANYHAAINIAISGLNECRRVSNQQGVDTFLEVIQGIVDTMRGEFGSAK